MNRSASSASVDYDLTSRSLGVAGPKEFNMRASTPKNPDRLLKMVATCPSWAGPVTEAIRVEVPVSEMNLIESGRRSFGLQFNRVLRRGIPSSDAACEYSHRSMTAHYKNLANPFTPGKSTIRRRPSFPAWSRNYH